MTPRQATTHKKILKMQEDNFPQDPAKWSILITPTNVSIHRPHGCGHVSVPRKDFDALVDWYQRDQQLETAKAV